MAHEVIPFPPRSPPPLPSPFASPAPGARILSRLVNLGVKGSINMSDEEINVEWWTEDSLDISLEVSGELYADTVSKVISSEVF